MTESGELGMASGEWKVLGGESGDCRWRVAILTADTQTTGSHAEQSEQARKLLEQLAGFHCTVKHDNAGAPYLTGHDSMHISLSHCRKAVAAATCHNSEVGIDIESRRQIPHSLMQRVCTPNELAAIKAAADPTKAFLQLWTRKEAVLKCRRTGIRGFESVVSALSDPLVEVHDIDCGSSDIIAAIATSRIQASM